METKITCVYPMQRDIGRVDLFGYSSLGLPGVNILGFGKWGHSLKEKLIYFTRMHGLKLPQKKYIICCEGYKERGVIKENSLQYIEFPMLVMLWTLAGLIPIKRLENCFCGGKIDIGGGIEYLSLSFENLSRLDQSFKAKGGPNWVYLSDREEQVGEKIISIPVRELFQDIKTKSITI